MPICPAWLVVIYLGTVIDARFQPAVYYWHDYRQFIKTAALMGKKLLPLLFGFVALAVFGASASGCSGMHSDRGGSSGIWVRISNRSSDDFERVTVTFPDGKKEYGALRHGASSDYQQVEKAYRYAAVQAVVKGESLTLQPQDFMGEKPLGPGRYTYALTADRTTRRLQLDLIQDR